MIKTKLACTDCGGTSFTVMEETTQSGKNVNVDQALVCQGCHSKKYVSMSNTHGLRPAVMRTEGVEK
jgi:ribosomal protein L33